MPDDGLAALQREMELRWDAHHRLHESHDKAHDREHAMTVDALGKAANSMEKRLEGMNEIRSQLGTQAATFQTLPAAKAEHDGIHTRIDELRERIVTIEKGDVKQEGRGLGQTATVAAIIGAVGFAVTVLGLIILVANVVTGTP